MKTICHISSLHSRDDTRIFIKECISISRYYKVFYVVSDGLGNNIVSDINIVDSGSRKKNRFARIFFTSLLTIIKSAKVRADIYHIHDPELILYLFVLKMFRPKAKIVFDVHENITKSIWNKEYLWFKSLIRIFYSTFEKVLIKHLYKILAEDSYIKEEVYSRKSIVVRNYPIISSFSKNLNFERSNNKDLFYMGSLTKERGLLEMCRIIQGVDNKDSKLHLVGQITDALKLEIQLMFDEEVFNRIIFHGRLNLDDGYAISKNCKIGLALLHPIKNYLESYPTKIFEYTACGLPFIVSDFPLYETVVKELETGFIIDPMDLKSQINLVKRILSDELDTETMCRKGYDNLIKKFNWESESEKLLQFYKKIL